MALSRQGSYDFLEYTNKDKVSDQFVKMHAEFFEVKSNKELAQAIKKGGLIDLTGLDQDVLRILFSFAAIHDQIDMMARLSKQIIQEQKGEPVIHLAAKANSVKAVTFLQAEIKATNQNGETVLHAAAASNSLDVMKFLKECKFNAEEKDHKGRAALHAAARQGCSEAAEFLIKEFKVEPKPKDAVGAMPLHLAAASGDYKTFDYLRAQHKEKEIEHIVDAKGQTVFHYSVQGDSVTRFSEDLLKEYKVDGNVPDDNGTTGLHLLADSGDYASFMFLLDGIGVDEVYKLDCNVKDKQGRSLLHVVVAKMHLDQKENEYYKMAQYLVNELKMDINVQDIKGRTPLHNAVRYEHSATVRTLLKDFKPNIEARDHNGRRAIHFAALHETPEVLNLLIEHGANCSVQDRDGHTPLSYARSKNRLPAVAVLEKKLELEEKSQTLAGAGAKRKDPPAGDAQQSSAKRIKLEAGASSAQTISRTRSYGKDSHSAPAQADSAKELKRI